MAGQAAPRTRCVLKRSVISDQLARRPMITGNGYDGGGLLRYWNIERMYFSRNLHDQGSKPFWCFLIAQGGAVGQVAVIGEVSGEKGFVIGQGGQYLLTTLSL